MSTDERPEPESDAPADGASHEKGTAPAADQGSDVLAASESASPSDAPPSGPGETARPRRMKKKKGSAQEAAASPAAPEVVDDSPEGRKLKEAKVAFEVGDYATARKLATELSRSERPAIADGARDLIRRTNVDPAQMVFLAACACALIAVAFYYLR